MKVLIVFLLILSVFQSDCLAAESRIADFSPIERQLPQSINLTDFSNYGDFYWYPGYSYPIYSDALPPETLPYWGVNGYCMNEDTVYVYAIYGYENHTLTYRSNTWFYRLRGVGVSYTASKPDFILSAPSSGISNIVVTSSGWVDNRNLLQNSELRCMTPPCTLECFNNAFSSIFPFDIFLNIPVIAITCPTLEFFGHVYDVCWLYELLRWFKYPIAVSLLIKLAMHL